MKQPANPFVVLQEANAGTLRAFLPYIRFRKGSDISVDEIEGAGTLEQSADGRAILTVYVQDRQQVLGVGATTGRAGRAALPSELGYCVARDVHGQEWSIDGAHFRTRSYTKWSAVEIMPHLIRVGRCEEPGTLLQQVQIWCDASLPVPYQQAGEVREELPNGSWAVHKRRVFDSAHGITTRAEFAQTAGLCRITLQSQSPTSPLHAAGSLVDALTWCLGVHVHWIGVQGGGSCLVQPRVWRAATPAWGMPLSYRSDIENWPSWWTLLAKILDKLVAPPDDISTAIRQLSRQRVTAATASPQAHAATVCVAVEHLARLLAPPKTADTPAIVQRWLGELECDGACEGSWKKRLQGLLSTLGGQRTVDQLHEFASLQLIDRKHPTQWNKLRNLVLHPGAGTRSDEEWMELTEPVVTCFNRLVMLAVGYTGRFTDWAQCNWPTTGG